MKIREFNGLNVIFDKKFELICAIHTVYLREHPELSDNEMEWVETPDIPYMKELEELINSVPHQGIIDIILSDAYSEESNSINVALCLDDNYDVVDELINKEYVEKYLGYETLYKFSQLLKDFANKIGWDEFFENHNEFYLNLVSDFCAFPENLNLNDIENFYNQEKKEYYYIPSILMNGGFGSQDGFGRYYYTRGFQYDNKEQKFRYDLSYLCECLFHEFSHPNINPLVDKYLKEFSNIDAILDDAVKRGLPKPYRNKATLLKEYFVRVNAKLLNLKYYDDVDFGWIKNNGFIYLDVLMKFVKEHKNRYETYEEFFVAELIPLMNNILSYQEDISHEVKGK